MPAWSKPDAPSATKPNIVRNELVIESERNSITKIVLEGAASSESVSSRFVICKEKGPAQSSDGPSLRPKSLKERRCSEPFNRALWDPHQPNASNGSRLLPLEKAVELSCNWEWELAQKMEPDRRTPEGSEIKEGCTTSKIVLSMEPLQAVPALHLHQQTRNLLHSCISSSVNRTIPQFGIVSRGIPARSSFCCCIYSLCNIRDVRLAQKVMGNVAYCNPQEECPANNLGVTPSTSSGSGICSCISCKMMKQPGRWPVGRHSRIP